METSGLLNATSSFLRAEVENIRRFDIPWRYRLWLYSNGFLSSKGALWGITSDTVGEYLSDLEYRRVKQIDSPYNSGLQNKLLFRLILSPAHGHLLPDVYGLVRDGQFVSFDRLSGLESTEELLDHLGNEAVVLKPVNASKGDGIRMLESDGGQFRISGEPVSRAQLVEEIRAEEESILEEHVSQAAYAAEIFPETTNTLRILTMIDPETDTPFVGTAAHRFGTHLSRPTDNWSAGGISAGVDADTGRLGPVVASPDHPVATDNRIGSHPDTGAQIAGISVPGWEQITDTICDLAAAYAPMWPHVGWDVVVRDDRGSITVLEGEPKSVDADQQAHDPLLGDPQVRRFYEHHGVLSEQ